MPRPKSAISDSSLVQQAGRPDGWIEVYLGSLGTPTASILAGTPVGKVAVPVTGDWQVYETIETVIESAEGEFDVVLNFDEVGSNTRSSLFNFNWARAHDPFTPKNVQQTPRRNRQQNPTQAHPRTAAQSTAQIEKASGKSIIPEAQNAKMTPTGIEPVLPA